MKIGPKYKICRRLGERVFSKCQTTKFTISGTAKKTKSKRRANTSEYGQQLLEKQKVKYTYGIRERQFANYIKEVRARKETNPVEELYKNLESRLDNIVYRLGLVNSRIFARQMVTHGHIMVNDRKVNIPSYRVKKGDVISVRPQSKDKKLFKWFEENKKDHQLLSWLVFDGEKMSGTVKSLPAFGPEVSTLNFNSILEFYSRV